MGSLEIINGFELQISQFLTPIFIAFVLISTGKLGLKLVDEFVSGMVFRARGYRTHDTVKINNASATISKIGFLSTHFQILNGSEYVEYIPVSNTRLDFTDVRLVIDKPSRVKRLQKQSEEA